MYSPALLEGHVRLSGVNHIPTELESLLQSCCVIDKAVEKEAQPSASGASLMYAGYPYDPYA
jgi:hypothetical protein